ncbi:MAG: oligoendopeptidase F family protein [Ignavibacteria bacterium]|nr:oligoendopeptidase F family protein [Ignavibacteria bacterium]
MKRGISPLDGHSYYYSNNYEDVIVHELGHRTHNYFKTEINSLFNDNFSIYLKDCTKRAFDEGKKEMQLREMVAEYYSLYFHGANIPQTIKELFRSLKL